MDDSISSCVVLPYFEYDVDDDDGILLLLLLFEIAITWCCKFGKNLWWILLIIPLSKGL